VIAGSMPVRLEYPASHLLFASLTPAEIDMSSRRARTLRVGAALAAIVLPLALAAPVQAAPSYTPQERAQAIVQPSVVFLETRVEGFVRLKANGHPVLNAPTIVYIRCTGFVVNSDGYIATAARCVRPTNDQIRWLAYYDAAYNVAKQQKLGEDKWQALAQQYGSTAEYQGATPADKPQMVTYAQRNVATSKTVTDPAVQVQVTEAFEGADGDVALVKMPVSKLPVAQITPVDLQAGTAAVAVGFANADTSGNSGTYTPTGQGVNVVGPAQGSVTAMHRLDRDLAQSTIGGPVASTSGQVVGLIDADNSTGDKARLVNPTAHLQALLEKTGVANTLTPADTAYRAGLDAYFGGRYSEAIKKLDSVIAADPANDTAKQYRKQAADRLAIEGDPNSSTPWMIIALAAAGAALVIVLIVVIVLMFSRRRRKRTENELLVPISINPFSGVPMSPTSTGGYPTVFPTPVNATQAGLPVPQPPAMLPPRPDADPAHHPTQHPTQHPAQHPAAAPTSGGPAPATAYPTAPPLPTQAPPLPTQAPPPAQPAAPPAQPVQPQPPQPPVLPPPPAQPAVAEAGPAVHTPPTTPLGEPGVPGLPVVPPPGPGPANTSGPAPEFVWPEDSEATPLPEEKDNPWAPPSKS